MIPILSPIPISTHILTPISNTYSLKQNPRANVFIKVDGGYTISLPYIKYAKLNRKHDEIKMCMIDSPCLDVFRVTKKENPETFEFLKFYLNLDGNTDVRLLFSTSSFV